mmetsp:Transcript_81885/g.171296  ORF Transcript_81885/g.171296 Transcript_81885/m.171296 type:complete len:311 (+) Transcript_81885:79-1011(+)|eukprot:CAMPEP_0206439628 /NCGR_PEP_ID=MMETSP0324_2-20121206/12317_1 /ASSEMBLY_ACC=CAM_ASM_000836 /TAXON_ID=2866 /ORGANISM="Crypthecodinium cohnii, Strain Seligo" /LENGTH=310 /DNA_ID=CAMNT_0053907271 /DNA_START=38 /DNA_END=970 /DNA_ORIENTATION=+
MDATAAAKGNTMKDEAAPPPPAAIPSSIFPRDGGWIDNLDKSITSPIHRLHIGPLEWPLSVPGCWFGVAPVLIVGPLTIHMLAIVVETGKTSLLPPYSLSLLASLWTCVLGLWFKFCAGDLRIAKRFLWAKELYLFAAPAGACLSLVAGNGASWSVGAFFPVAWCAALAIAFVLKGKTKRRRPLVCECVQKISPPRTIDIIPTTLRWDPVASLPSGDVAGAAAFAYTLARGTGCYFLAAFCLACSGFGRMYWLAHHFFDVLMGAAVGVGACVVIEVVWVKVDKVCLWHVILAHTVMLIFLRAAMKAVKHD